MALHSMNTAIKEVRQLTSKTWLHQLNYTYMSRRH